MANRKEFLEEAIVLGPAGVVSLLIDGHWRVPVTRRSRILSTKEMLSEFFQQVMDIGPRALMCCWARRDVRIAKHCLRRHTVTTRSGALVSGVDRRFKAFVLMAGPCRDEVGRAQRSSRSFLAKDGDREG